jgi:hypothetical protein
MGGGRAPAGRARPQSVVHFQPEIHVKLHDAAHAMIDLCASAKN